MAALEIYNPERYRTIRSKGFMLPELMIAAVIAVIILAATYGIFEACELAFIRGNDYLDIHSDARSAMDLMISDIRCSSQAVKTKSPYTASNTCIILETPSIDASKNAIPGKYDYIVYYLQGTDLNRVVIPDASSSRSGGTSVRAENAGISFSSGGTGLSSLTALQTSALTNIDVSLTTSKSSFTLGGHSLSTTPETLSVNIKLRNR